MAGISAYAPPATFQLSLFAASANNQGFQPGKIVYVDGWLYVDLYDMFDDVANPSSRLARVPTTVVRPPQDILPEAIVTRHTIYASGNSAFFTTSMVFAIGASTVYWVQLPPSGYVNGPAIHLLRTLAANAVRRRSAVRCPARLHEWLL